MKKLYTITIVCLLVLFTSCAPSIKITDYKPNLYKTNKKKQDSIFVPNPIRVSTFSTEGNYPYIHINGFKSYEITKSKIVKNKDSLFANELKFYATYSSFYSRAVMYQQFGNWNKNIFIRGDKKPFLIWEKVKLFPDKNDFYYVIAGGYECTTCKPSLKTIYSSVIVLDENKNDCLTDENPALKKEILNFFSEGIRNLTNSNEFYDKFWSLVLNKKKS
ncbi:hypothetical protein [Polaribacter sp. Asnod1-A03]|uniref:hypothetical protein n=1 Tax=Polaribacter sp. Asnod1-A03 TaxID=3160581 RepID=UPI00386A7787